MKTTLLYAAMARKPVYTIIVLQRVTHIVQFISVSHSVRKWP